MGKGLGRSTGTAETGGEHDPHDTYQVAAKVWGKSIPVARRLRVNTY